MSAPQPNPSLFSRGSWLESSRIAENLRRETVGGILLLIAAVIALVWANSPWSDSYFELTHFEVGPKELHLDLSLHTWAADGLLAIFFFVVGLELKREFVAGDLRDPRRAALPIVAAAGGMIVPALIYVVVNASSAEGQLTGWAIPTATDIAFAVAVLAVISTHLPIALRTFLLTLAVVDDLLAVTIIAVFYTADLKIIWLLAGLVPIALFGLAMQRGYRQLWLVLPLAALAWTLVHESGVHATVAGVLLGFTVPVLSKPGDGLRTGLGTAEHLEHLIRPISAGFAIPVFAFFAAGVSIGGIAGLGEAFRDPIAIGIVLGLVLGKPIGVMATTWLLARFTHATLDPSVKWVDVLGVAMLAGIGFTVSLLIGDLAFGEGSEADDHVKIAVLFGSVISAILAAVLLVLRNRAYRLVEQLESRDDDADGVPDVYET